MPTTTTALTWLARWDRQLDVARAQAVLRGELPFVPAPAAAPPVAAAPAKPIPEPVPAGR